MAAPDGDVLDTAGRAHRLSTFTRDRITLLGFIYTTCVDPEGCPLAYRVFDALRPAIEANPATRHRVRLVTLSFDPAVDTPAAGIVREIYSSAFLHPRTVLNDIETLLMDP